DADDAVYPLTDGDRLAKDVGASAIARLPIVVTEHGDGRALRPMVFRWTEVATERGRGVEEMPVARADHADTSLGGLVAGADGEIEIEEGRCLREGFCVLRELHVARVAHVGRQVVDAVAAAAEVDEIRLRGRGEKRG